MKESWMSCHDQAFSETSKELLLLFFLSAVGHPAALKEQSECGEGGGGIMGAEEDKVRG